MQKLGSASAPHAHLAVSAKEKQIAFVLHVLEVIIPRLRAPQAALRVLLESTASPICNLLIASRKLLHVKIARLPDTLPQRARHPLTIVMHVLRVSTPMCPEAQSLVTAKSVKWVSTPTKVSRQTARRVVLARPLKTWGKRFALVAWQVGT